MGFACVPVKFTVGLEPDDKFDTVPIVKLGVGPVGPVGPINPVGPVGPVIPTPPIKLLIWSCIVDTVDIPCNALNSSLEIVDVFKVLQNI